MFPKKETNYIFWTVLKPCMVIPAANFDFFARFELNASAFRPAFMNPNPSPRIISMSFQYGGRQNVENVMSLTVKF